MESLGQFLKREREFRGISVERLAGMTRINAGVLKKLEEDDFGKSTQAVYIRSFLKSCAQQLGLDAREVLKKYEGQYVPVAETKETVQTSSQRISGGFGPRLFRILAFAVVASLIAVAVLLKRR